MWNAGMDEAQAGIKIAGRNINNLRYADDMTLMAESEEELKNLLRKLQEESEKAGLKLNVQKTNIMASSCIILWQIDGEKVETVTDLFPWAPKSLQTLTAAMKLKDTYFLEEKLWPRQHMKNQTLLCQKGLYSQSYGFSNSHIQMLELDCKEGWATRNWCFWTVVPERTLNSPLDRRKVKPVNPERNQPWIFFRRADAESKTLMLGKIKCRGRMGWQRMR